MIRFNDTVNSDGERERKSRGDPRLRGDATVAREKLSRED